MRQLSAGKWSSCRKLWEKYIFSCPHACLGSELLHFAVSCLPGRIAALNMLAHGTEISTVPYLWTAMFGKSIRYAGEGFPGTVVESVLVELFWDTEVVTTLQCQFQPPQLAQGDVQGHLLFSKA